MDFATLAAQLNAGTIWPEGIVIITLLVVLVGDLIVGRSFSRWVPYVAITGLLAAIVALYLQWDNFNPMSFFGAFNSDDLSIMFRGIIALSTAVTILMSDSLCAAVRVGFGRIRRDSTNRHLRRDVPVRGKRTGDDFYLSRNSQSLLLHADRLHEARPPF